MTSPEDVVCYVVSDVIKHLASLGKKTPTHDPFDLNTPRKADISGVIARIDGVTHATIGFLQEPDEARSLILSEPVFAPNSTPSASAACFRCMLSTVIAHAQKYHLNQVRFLNWEPQHEAVQWLPHELELAGFSVQASIVGWTANAEALAPNNVFSPAIDISVNDLFPSCFDTSYDSSCSTHLTADMSRQHTKELCRALESILSETNDLKGLPTPDAATLLQAWASQRYTLLTAETPSKIVGLCAFVFKQTSVPQSTSSIHIEYIGVSPDMRRTGIARQMLSFLSHRVCSTGNRNPAITAYADKDNHPASAFYFRSGFEVMCRGRLWSRQIAKS